MFSISSNNLYAMATQRRLSAAMSSITFLKIVICNPGNLHLKEHFKIGQKQFFETTVKSN
jgi:hypothetical protein